MPEAASMLDRLRETWRSLTGQERGDDDLLLAADLPPADLARVKEQMRICLDGRGGEVTARRRAAVLGHSYLRLNAEGRGRFLHLLADDFAADSKAVDAAIAVLAQANDDRARAHAQAGLRAALAAPRVRLLTQFNALPEGVKFLVDLRAELLGRLKSDPALFELEDDLRGLLASWFDVGFLELRRITWSSPAALLEKLIAYEAVHAIQSWNDLKNRLDSDRRLFGFFHPRMPDEPLIFVEVALVQGLSDNIQTLLDPDAPVLPPAQADTAIFYSISNAQKGLAGISFGNFLIKRVVDELRHEFSQLKQFATLSPIPGFRDWLDNRIKAGEAGLLTKSEHRALTAAVKGKGAKGGLKALLTQKDWPTHDAARKALEAPLMRLCARYLAQESRSGDDSGEPPRALDPVGHFHLTNGARIERINWLGDISPKGLRQSAGMMVNYLYKLTEIDANHENYSAEGKVAVGASVRALLKD